MLFVEKKTEDGYDYDAHNVIGKLHIESGVKLDGEILDGMVGLLLRNNLKAQTVKGTVEHEGTTISYVLDRDPAWQENEKHDTDESWSGTPTSTQKQESASTQRRRLRIPTLSWLRRFVVAFREAFKKAGSYQQTGARSRSGKN